MSDRYKDRGTVASDGIGIKLDEGISSAPGVVVGVLLIIAAVMWFSPGARHKFRKATLWLVIVAVAMIIIFGYLNAGQQT
ncbi:hypothetical protein [Glycomyces rhizosphaerae]|uniref:Uncharacterized protein n=1 Tax=Glycomyces rhizosphaerae TaxID=2054422 RepID=A0ABV7Q752_9ACTN